MFSAGTSTVNDTAPDLENLERSIGAIVPKVTDAIFKYQNGVFQKCGYWFSMLSCKISYVSFD
jgi:hypothetical protein